VIVDQRLVDAASNQLERRWPNPGWRVAAAAYLDGGEIITSIGLDNLNSGASLCAEAGALCQAYTMNRPVVASACVCRDEDGVVSVLAPCGICRERLALWGPDVQVAVTDSGSPTGWSSRSLGELNPYYWGARFADGDGWPSARVHRS
jgi:cytidine deaminase